MTGNKLDQLDNILQNLKRLNHPKIIWKEI